MRNAVKHILVLTLILLMAISAKAQTVSAEPIGGKTLARNFINRSIVYPEKDLANNNSGSVVISFTVDEQGRSYDFSTISSISDEAAVAATDVIKKINWKPSLENGIPTTSQQRYEVIFNAKSYKRNMKKRVTIPLPDYPIDTTLRIYDNRATDEWSHPYLEKGKSFAIYVMENMVYPEEAKRLEIGGTVKISFVVETDGNTSNIEVIEHVGGGCDKEAIRLVEASRWVPSVKNGQIVRSLVYQDISFGISGHNFIDGNSY